MFWLEGKIDRIHRDIERLTDIINQLAMGIAANNVHIRQLEITTNTNDQTILSQLQLLIDIFNPRATYVAINLGGTMPLPVGSSSVATVAVLDQFGQPMPAFDFTANPPTWTLSDPTPATVAAGTAPGTETVTGVAAGAEILSVSVPGVVNGTATLSFTVAAPAPVATSVSIATSPDITG